MDVAIHSSLAISYQQKWGSSLESAFVDYGLDAIVTADINYPADIHVVQGPWYSKRRWLGHPKTILLDRCYYRGDPDHVSLGWMNERGGRSFKRGRGRVGPTIGSGGGSSSGSIYLADYNRKPDKSTDSVRYHPTNVRTTIGLREQLSQYRVAYGHTTTALVEAALMGLEVHSSDPDHILNQPDWLELLPYADWHIDELAQAVTHLMETYEPSIS